MNDRTKGTITPARSPGKLPKLRDMKPRPVQAASKPSLDQVRVAPLLADGPMPLQVTPDRVALDLGIWLEGQREWVEKVLVERGALLFRGFERASIEGFQGLAESLSGDLMDYTERSTPRRRVQSKVFTSTEYPADQEIPLHNENSYAHLWPMKIWFSCVRAAAEGGATPIADSRRVLAQIPEATRERFRRFGVLYQRNYTRSLGLSWQEAYQTDRVADVEEYLASHGARWEWKGKDHLQALHVRPAEVSHPHTGEPLWFNQAHLFHVSSLAPEVRKHLQSLLREEELPRHAYYGDGRPILDEDLEAIRRAYRHAEICFSWREGDVLLLDNMLVSHGRQPFSGERRIVVAMADPMNDARMEQEAALQRGESC